MNIEPIRLTAGTHPDTASTGVGCFMNVIAYLNGEPQITDKSECVCFVVRPIAIWANDWMTDDERAELLPFVLRAMGSRTDDVAEIVRRARLAADMAQTMSGIAATRAAYAAAAAADATTRAAAARAARAKIRQAIITFLDAALPRECATGQVIDARVQRLIELQTA